MRRLWLLPLFQKFWDTDCQWPEPPPQIFSFSQSMPGELSGLDMNTLTQSQTTLRSTNELYLHDIFVKLLFSL